MRSNLAGADDLAVARGECVTARRSRARPTCPKRSTIGTEPTSANICESSDWSARSADAENADRLDHAPHCALPVHPDIDEARCSALPTASRALAILTPNLQWAERGSSDKVVVSRQQRQIVTNAELRE